MTTEMKQLYDAAVASDHVWWDALEEMFGGEAATARYDARGVSTAVLRELYGNFRMATESWLTAVRLHRANSGHAGGPPPEPIILSVRFTALPVNILEPMPEVWAVFDDGEEKMLFSYYPDEISFTESDFVGLTEQQARRLRHERDVGYLRS
jgi:hypothetical protein